MSRKKSHRATISSQTPHHQIPNLLSGISRFPGIKANELLLYNIFDGPRNFAAALTAQTELFLTSETQRTQKVGLFCFPRACSLRGYEVIDK